MRVKKKRSLSNSVKKAKLPPVIVEKSEGARTVLIIGDFFSGSLAKGLDSAFSGNSEIVVVDKSNGLSGFVRNDIVDWPVQLPQIMSEVKPDFVVAMLGSNDLQLMRLNGTKLKKRTPEWDAAYQKRVEALGRSLKSGGVPYIWVGLPPVRFKNMNKEFLFLNEIYARAAKSSRGKFIDVWDGFSDADGNYSRSGPDVNGQIVLLRPKDGINLTKAGRRRLAFYVEGPISKALNAGENTFVNSSLAFDVEESVPESNRYNPARTGKTIVIKLDDPKNDGAETLAGKTIHLDRGAGKQNTVPLPQKDAGAKAETPTKTVTRGRVDDHSWPPSDATTTTTPALAIAN